MMKTPTIIETQVHEMDDELTEKYLDYQEARHAVSKQDDVLRSRDYRRRTLKIKPSSQRTSQYYLALLDDRIAAICHTSFRTSEQETNTESMWAWIQVLQEYQQQGICRLLLDYVVKFAKQHNKTKLETGFFPSDNEFSSTYVVDKLGFKMGFNEHMSRIYRDKINWDYITRQEEKLEDLSKKYIIRGFDQKEYANWVINDDLAAKGMADFFTEADNILPREDADWNEVIVTINDVRIEAQKIFDTMELYSSYLFICFDGDNPVGYSGTYFDNDPPVRDVGTGLTAVRKAYQGQGIAKYLKIRMLRYLVDNYPDFEYIHTGNVGSNAGMLHINHSLGFAYHSEWHLYQGSVASIQSYLEK